MGDGRLSGHNFLSKKLFLKWISVLSKLDLLLNTRYLACFLRVANNNLEKAKANLDQDSPESLGKQVRRHKSIIVGCSWGWFSRC